MQKIKVNSEQEKVVVLQTPKLIRFSNGSTATAKPLEDVTPLAGYAVKSYAYDLPARGIAASKNISSTMVAYAITLDPDCTIEYFTEADIV